MLQHLLHPPEAVGEAAAEPQGSAQHHHLRRRFHGRPAPSAFRGGNKMAAGGGGGSVLGPGPIRRDGEPGGERDTAGSAPRPQRQGALFWVLSVVFLPKSGENSCQITTTNVII